MGDHLARGEEYERKAEKKLNSCGWWGSKFAKVEGAADLFLQAAYCFKLAESWNRAGSAYMESAKYQLKGKNTYGAILTFVHAADCYKKTSSKEAIITCLEHAVNVLIDIGSIGRAARYYKDIGDLYESEQNLERAVDYFERAADLFQSEELILFVHECKEKVAQVAAQLEQYQKATEIYEEIALYYLQEGLKFGLRKRLLHAGLCQVSKVDIVAIENALACYQELDPTFSETHECRFLKDLADAIDKVDAVKLSDAVKEFTDITPLDSWEATLLLRVKKKLEAMELGNEYLR
ncbi:hypothetical protein ACJRO7_017632 [Eucalyptus globulus]|uniref:Alpha-soluble NSF attachment protein n=1 Tax=Eucalyptus globulus TaxID=34317 RepID=A0ABD3KSP2_EUCGL